MVLTTSPFLLHYKVETQMRPCRAVECTNVLQDIRPASMNRGSTTMYKQDCKNPGLIADLPRFIGIPIGESFMDGKIISWESNESLSSVHTRSPHDQEP